MSSEWQTSTLAEIASNISRPFKFNDKETVIFINTGDVLDGDFLHREKISKKGLPGQAKKAIEPGDILYSEIRPGNKRHLLVNEESVDSFVVSTKFMVIKAIGPVSPEYLYLVLTGQECETEFKIIADSRSGTFPQVTFDSISYYPIRYPKPGTQQRIVEFSAALTNKIQLNKNINQTLEQMAQAIFKSWFVDFEPVKAKIAALEAGGSEDDALLAAMQAIAGSALFATDAADADAPTRLARLQTEHPEQYATLRATAELFPSAMQESELGEIPEGWEAKPFGELLIKTIGGDWGKEEPDEKHTEKVKILRGTDLPHVYAGSDDKVPTRYVDPKKLATRKLENGDIVIEVSGGSPTQPTGRSLYLTQEIINRLNADLEPASFCRLFRPESKEAGLILGLHLQKIYGEGKTWLYQNTSTGISNFQTKMFLEKELIVLPPLEMQASFYTLVMPYLQKISSAENKVLAELRDVLLPKLLSGELSISAATDQITQAEEAIDV